MEMESHMASEGRYTGMIQRSHSVKVRTKGHWITVPGIGINGDILITTGKRLRIAKIRGEEMRETEIEDPELYLSVLKNDDKVLKADIFTFTAETSIDAAKIRISHGMGKCRSYPARQLQTVVGGFAAGEPQERQARPEARRGHIDQRLKS